MKAQILKIAKVGTVEEFYKKFPTEESFMAKHGGAFKKAMLGEKLKKAQGGDAILAALGQGPKQGLGFNPGQQDIGMPKSLGYNLSGNATGQQMDFSGNPIQGLSAQQSLTSQGMSGITDVGGKGAGMMGKLKGMTDLPGKIAGGIKKIKAEKAAMKKAQQWEAVSDVSLAASRTSPEPQRRQYARPEDFENTGEAFFPVYGVGTNAITRNGGKIRNKVKGGNKTEIQNTYAPGTIYDDQGYAPLQKANFGAIATGVGGDMFGQVTKQLYGENAGSELGGDLGGAVGSLIGPVGQVVGKEVGKLAGWALDRNPAKMKKAQESTMRNVGMMGAQNMGQSIQSYNQSFMEDGGKTSPYGWMSNTWQPQVITNFGGNSLKNLLKEDPMMDTLRTGGQIRENSGYPDFAMGGDLKTHWGGYAEPISENPYLPDGGETVMFRGNSHDESDGRGKTGIGITYGNSPVEVERGEPAVKLQDGTGADSDLVVFGNLKIPNEYIPMLGDNNAKGKKFKSYVADLSKTEARQNKIVDKSSSEIDDLQPNSPFDKLKMSSFQANIMGANMKLKDIAEKKQNAAALQQAINDTAEEYGYVADDLAKGQIKKAQWGVVKNIAKGEANKLLKGAMEKAVGRPATAAPVGAEKMILGESQLSPWVTYPAMGGVAAVTTAGGVAVANKNARDREIVRKAYESVSKTTPSLTPVPPAERSGSLVDEYLKKKRGELRYGGMLRADDGEQLERLNPEDYERLKKMYETADVQKRGKAVEEFQREFARLAPNRAKSVLKNFGVTNYGKKAGLSATDPASNFDQIFGDRTRAYRAAMDEGQSPVWVGPDYPVPQETLPSLTINESDLDLTNKPVAPEKKDRFPWEDVVSGLIPYIRPSDAEALDAQQLAGEMYAMSTNQLEPVWAQKFQPQLTVPYDISLQDVLNENQAAFRAAQRSAGYNPAAQANFAAQQYSANQKVLGEQFRMNQAQKNQVYAQNRQLLDEAQLQNLNTLDKQYVRQEEAKSRTKETAQAALNSISSKFLQNQRQNRELQTYENLYNFRFGADQRAQNWNPLAQFNIPTVAGASQDGLSEYERSKALVKAYEDKQNEKVKTAAKAKSRNGSIVSAMKKF